MKYEKIHKMNDLVIESNGWIIKIKKDYNDCYGYNTKCSLVIPSKHWIWAIAPDKDPRNDPLSLYYPGYPETLSERYKYGWVFSDAPFKIDIWNIHSYEISWLLNSYHVKIIYDSYKKMVAWLNDPINGYRHESILFYREPNKRAKRHAIAIVNAVRLRKPK